ncbi:MAG TPA: hypothetical protein VGX22_01885, partial [Candidatus Dormibacteraeota bacterium]|nr:hypothetical protein [Candidatus Dormibacteraeota bacterium]
MDSERELKTEFRRALDDVLPPSPWLEAAVTDDLRNRQRRTRMARPADRSQKTRAALPRFVVPFVAGVLVVVVAVAAVAAYLELNYRFPQSQPAGAVSVEAYQAMVSRDVNQLPAGPDGSCTTLQSVCPAPGRPFLTALQHWLDDLNRVQPPARFAVIDGELRHHIAANISDINALLAAYKTRDQQGLDRAYSAGNDQDGLVRDLAANIVASQQGTVPAYIASVATASGYVNACLWCQSLSSSSQVDCTDIQAASCETDVTNAMATIEVVEAALIRIGAPDSLSTQDLSLQVDLARADSGMLDMASAQLTGDRTGFDAGRVLFRQALPAIRADSGRITPPGSPLPAQLLGDWLMPAAAANIVGQGACPSPLAVATCMFRLTFTATTYNWTTNVPGYSGGGGYVVANGTELAFFNGHACDAY